MTTAGERYRRGRALRAQVPRAAHAVWAPPSGRRPPAAPAALRPAATPLALLCATPAAMAADLARTPVTGLDVQAAGDAHLLNFGAHTADAGPPLFGLTGYDHTHPGPWEWDVKRLAASLAVAALQNGHAEGAARYTARCAATAYREWVRGFAEMSDIDVFTFRQAACGVLDGAPLRRRRPTRPGTARDGLPPLWRLTEACDGARRITDDPPLLDHAGARPPDAFAAALTGYLRTLGEDAAALLGGYRVTDAAREASGGHLVALTGRDEHDPLVLAVRPAGRSALAPHVRPAAFPDPGHRVVAGRRRIQPVPDPFLGWGAGPGGRRHVWCWLRDVPATPDPTRMRLESLAAYGAACAQALARAHALTGDRIALAGYLGSADRFDRAVAAFAVAYAAQNAADHREFRAARLT
ncbi:DUF2252 family protein [Actinomadura flavalba]|uniref:DUF2252 family protein n=1 Tax=Actinomadura flavalba TaxID=1120938 RepID=UPI00037994AB|nr:DUF2252 family protein [Actinomadura flavalba]